MSSQLDVRLGEQTPTILHSPPDVHSLAAAEECIELADAYGVCDGYPLAESQKITLRNGLGERSDGSWAATRIADFGPRQGTGKNDKIAARELAGLFLFGEELLIHTAHEFPTANESFLRLVTVLEAWDDLRKKVAHIYTANGAQAIHLLSGQRLLYKARTGGGGRGFAKADVIVYDEAQHLQAEHVAASGPAKMANPNSQTWYAGSGGLSTSVKAWEIRRDAIFGTGGRLAYTEMTAQKVSVVDGRVAVEDPSDPTDREVWYRCIAGLGRWVTEESVEALRDELKELFPREGLCVWEPDPLDGMGVVDMQKWAALADESSTVSLSLSYGLSVAPDASWSAIGSAGRRKDGLIHVDNVEMRPGTGWVVSRVAELYAKRRIPIRVNPAAADGALIKALTDAKVEVIEVDARSYQQACGAFLMAVNNGELRHIDQQSMNIAAVAAGRRDIGKEGGWVWAHGARDISPLTAATLALSGVEDNEYDALESVL